MTAVVFNCDTFRSIYPAFSDETRVTDAALQMCFATACEIVGNDETSLVPYDPDATPPVMARYQVLYALTCHLATLQYLFDPKQAGAMSNASQGSVSVGFAINTGSDEWWNRTQCGAIALMMLKQYSQGGLYFGAVFVNQGG